MTIAQLREKSKALLLRVPRDAVILGILILASSASFGLGILAGRDSVRQGSGIRIEQVPMTGGLPAAAVAAGSAPVSIPAGGQYIASKNGTKYYLPWCGSANTISEANKIWFATKEAAEAKGYTPAANCKGI